MSKRRAKSETKTSEYDYLEEAKHNAGLASQWLNTVFPELSELKRIMDTFEITPDDLIDFMYHVRVVKTHGYGNISTNIFAGKITKIEGLIRTLKERETEIAK